MLQIRFSSYLPPNLKPCFAYDAFLQYVILLFPVVIYFLNIIIVIQEIKNSSDICNISLIGQRHICLWNHGYFRRCHRNVLLFKCLMYRIKIFRSGSDLKAVIRIGKSSAPASSASIIRSSPSISHSSLSMIICPFSSNI